MKHLIIRCNKNNCIQELVRQCFESMKFYLLRIEYTTDEYNNHLIPWKSRILQLTIWITAMCWLNIIFWIAILKWPEYVFPISFDDIDQMTAVHGSKLISFVSICAFSTLEYVWCATFYRLINYDLRINDLIVKYSQFGQNNLSERGHQYIYNLIRITNMFTGILGSIRLTLLTIYFILLNIILFKSYLHKNLISIIRIIISLPISTIIYCRLIYTIGQGFVAFKFLIIIIEFYIIQLKELMYKTRQIFRHRNQENLIKINNRRYYFRYFQRKYSILYDEILKINQIVSIFLFAIDMLSKFSIIICALFYSQQIDMNLFNISFIISLILMFCSATGIYSRLANVPSYNQQCCRQIFEWNARFQSMSTNHNVKREWRRNFCLHKRMVIKMNMFMQTMTDNHLGFTCGQLFSITKYKYSELIMFSIVLVLLFYKKICLNLDIKF
ncbi:hypothetical protein HUG17_9266 [Dermatophagoides farinae]|uniref:Uncharacterized protein n=1 Tax=Dermatophagoides farinae TaxID=6954 RepID=A0A9D4NTU1_DERFA|nr:hypothetical protein HUG17_9266 [Dermatophagoides farinae]